MHEITHIIPEAGNGGQMDHKLIHYAIQTRKLSQYIARSAEIQIESIFLGSSFPQDLSASSCIFDSMSSKIPGSSSFVPDVK